MVWLIEMTLGDHLRWKWVRSCFIIVYAVLFSVAHKRPRYMKRLDRPSGGNSFRIESSFGVLGNWTTVFHETHALLVRS